MRKKIGIFLGAIMLMAAIFSGCSNSATVADKGSANVSSDQNAAIGGKLTIKMLNVGQGDAILLQTADQTVLIDTSDLDEQDKLRQELKKAGVKKIDKLILTHPHADHIGGVAGVVLQDYQVGEVYDDGMPSKSKVYLNYMKLLKQKNIKRHGLTAGETLDFGSGVKFEVLAPAADLVAKGQEKGYKHDPNNESVVGRLVYGDFSMMFTGDAEKAEESTILSAFTGKVKSKVLKAGHHGSKTSSSSEFLRAVQPEAVVISCGAGNDYGHPHKETMKKYRALKLQIFETDKNGTITITSDGKSYQIEPEQGAAQ